MFFYKNIIAFSDCCAYGDTFYAQIFLKKTCPSSRNKPNRKQDLFRHKLNGIQGGRFMDLNRRQILCGLGGIACGAACAGLINPKEDAHAASEKMQRFQQAGGDFGWKPHKLDVEQRRSAGIV